MFNYNETSGLRKQVSSRGRSVVRAFVSSLFIFGPAAAFNVSTARAEIVWGANGHPLISYPGVTFETQLDLVKGFGGSYYRIDVTSIEKLPALLNLIAIGRKKNVQILPVLVPPYDLKSMDPKDLYSKSLAFANYFASRIPEIGVWELGNELENYAIIQPCERRDDGTQYPCEWGPAGGVGPSEYYGPRYEKVAAVLRGLSEGIKSGNPSAKRAIGSAGWGHVGIFERLNSDNIAWDISVWHSYGKINSWPFEQLQKYKKPIWVTEFNHNLGSQKDGEEGQAAGLKEMMETLRRYEKPYGVEAAFIYELLDEEYWAPNFEAYMGLVKLKKDDQGHWELGSKKAAYKAAKDVIQDGAKP
ncbi:glycosyl hydrolase [Methylobacterium sp. J-030]|uniref:glycosyl hydrolase n=1 Tax=Methylobacterium sp. J-030 TaxID=2836627 RepID=UPI001FBBABCD|nr:glycosyl hydrolase [Methylobacterium sp. J-030]MCJ2070025.1 glycosyl hydrolase [Methylobacterium sp. J-030]